MKRWPRLFVFPIGITAIDMVKKTIIAQQELIE